MDNIKHLDNVNDSTSSTDRISFLSLGAVKVTIKAHFRLSNIENNYTASLQILLLMALLFQGCRLCQDCS